MTYATINIDIVNLQAIKKAVANLLVQSGQETKQTAIVNQINDIVKSVYKIDLDDWR